MPQFVSKCKNQVLTIRPNTMQIVNGIANPVPGQHIQFEDGIYATEDAKELQFLRKHRLNGSAFIEAEPVKKEASKA